MTTWIVTIGSSDIKLKDDKNWNKLQRKVQSKFRPHFFQPSGEPKEYLTVPPRVLGIVYGDEPDYYRDLVFPILDACSQTLLNRGSTIPDRIIFILTDQSELFPINKRQKKSPYWQDTCTLKPILDRYCQHQENLSRTELIYRYLKPKATEQGLDDWNGTLKLVQNTLASIEFDKTGNKKTVYVSHQAGTPAISSAIQFMSLSRWGKQVKFLVCSELTQKPADVIDSSTYLQGIQVQQAKRLIISGSPGAAQELLNGLPVNQVEQLEKLVNFFNLNHSSTVSKQEFEVKAATQRIVDALDLIGIFFKQKSYLLGIALLASAQETFLKVAIINKIKDKKVYLNIKGNKKEFRAEDLVQWTESGLFIISDRSLENKFSLYDNQEIINLKIDILSHLNFPVSDSFLKKKLQEGNTGVTNSNQGMLKWLDQLKSDFNSKHWPLLEWSYIGKEKYKEYADDRRNQLLHNLLGMEEQDVIQYLLGNKEPNNTDDVLKVYNNQVKRPFADALKFLNLSYEKEDLNKRLGQMAAELDLVEVSELEGNKEE